MSNNKYYLNLNSSICWFNNKIWDYSNISIALPDQVTLAEINK